jgi:DNA-binding transcriptional MerR regulator
MSENFYNLKAVCKLTGLRPATLHAWEKRYHAVTPFRTETNHRVYSASDVEKLRLLVTAKDLGQSIGSIAHLPLEQLQHLVDSLSLQTSPSPAKTHEKKQRAGSSTFSKRTLQALEDFNLDRVYDEIENARNRFDTVVFILDILVPLFAHINRMVEQRRLSMARQHLISNIILANLYTEILRLRVDRSLGAAITAKKGVFAGFDRYHECGILMSTLLCMDRSMKVYYFGTSVPAKELAEAAAVLKADFIVLATPKVKNEQLPQGPESYLRELASLIPRYCELWLGGDDAGLLAQHGHGRKLHAFSSLHEFHRHIVRLTKTPSDLRPRN